MRIISEKTLGVVIDVQDKLYPHMHEKEEFLKRISILIQGLQILDIPLIFTEQYTRGLGNTVEPVKNLLSVFNPIEKISFSCCDEPLFMDQMLRTGRKFVILSGMETHICVLQTMEDLKELGYIPVIVEDCIVSRKNMDKQNALQRMHQDGAIITSSESVLFELCRHAGNERFKAISAIVK